MTTIENYVETCKNIYQLSENKIASFFEQGSKELALTDLATDIAKELDLKHAEVTSMILIWLRQRPDLALRNNKYIYQPAVKADKLPMTPQECALKYYDLVKSCSPEIINNSFLAAEEKLRVTNNVVNAKARLNLRELSEAIGDKLNVKPYVVYYCLRKYIQEERKDLYIGLGRGGGVMKVAN